MSLQGLPDFQRPFRAGELQVFFPYERGGPHVLTPSSLEVAPRDDSTPDFSLELVRGKNPLLPPAPYGVLDFRIGARYMTDEALTLLRAQYPRATIRHSIFTAGFLRFHFCLPRL